MISPEYKKIIQEQHKKDPRWGSSPYRYNSHIGKFFADNNVKSVLDYGCGKGTFIPKCFPVSVTNYDPGIPEWDKKPAPHEYVLCMDVLEHIEPQQLNNVLKHLAFLIKNRGMFVISCAEATEILPDGRNAHLIVREDLWWINKLRQYFNVYEAKWIKQGSFMVFVSHK